MLLFLACTHSDPVQTQSSTPQEAVDTAETTESTDSVPPEPELAAWTFMVYMDGDNDLESWVSHDLNELEAGWPSTEIRVLVMADRAEGYDEGDGDWTGGRLYEIKGDSKIETVTSEIIEELAEPDMANPATLANFLAWAAQYAPAEHYALSLWDHGSGWWIQGTPPPGVAWDESSEKELGVASGALGVGLQGFVDQYGPLDLLAFDACNMAAFEVAYAMSPYAQAMAAAETTVGYQGLQYSPALAFLSANPQSDGKTLADLMAQQAVLDGGEMTFSAVDLEKMHALGAALDAVAAVALENPVALTELQETLYKTRAVEHGYHPYTYLDLKNFADQLVLSVNPELAAAGLALSEATQTAVLGAYAAEGHSWTGGLTLFGDSWGLDRYSAETALWAQQTRWDDLLRALAAL